MNLETLKNMLAAKVDYLESVMENIERIKEERDSLQKQLERCKNINSELGEIKAGYMELVREKEEWKGFLNKFGNETGFESPYALARLVSELRMEVASLKDEMGELKAKESNHVSEISRSDEEVIAHLLLTTIQRLKKCDYQ